MVGRIFSLSLRSSFPLSSISQDKKVIHFSGDLVPHSETKSSAIGSPIQENGSNIQETGYPIRETGILILDFRWIEVKNDNYANMVTVSLFICT